MTDPHSPDGHGGTTASVVARGRRTRYSTTGTDFGESIDELSPSSDWVDVGHRESHRQVSQSSLVSNKIARSSRSGVESSPNYRRRSRGSPVASHEQDGGDVARRFESSQYSGRGHRYNDSTQGISRYTDANLLISFDELQLEGTALVFVC